MDKYAVVEILDKAISKTVNEEFELIAQGKPEITRMWQRNNSRDDIIHSLRSLTPPNYSNPMVAVIYSAMYQLQHINLTYSLVSDILVKMVTQREALAGHGKLQVVDFGAGCLAMQFGVALALAELQEQREKPLIVHVDSMDSSKRMLTLGEKIWENLVSLLMDSGQRTSSRLHSLYRAASSISYRTHTDISTSGALEDFDQWLSAIHAFYPLYEGKVRADLFELYRRIKPVVGLFTCYGDHTGKGHVPLVNRVTPFEANRFDVDLLGGQELHEQFSHNRHYCPETISINKNWGLIENPPATRRTSRAVLNWDYDTAIFAYMEKVPKYYHDARDTIGEEWPKNEEMEQQLSPKPTETVEINPAQVDSPVVSQSQVEETLPSMTKPSFSAGDRVRVDGVGNGILRQINKNKATVILSNGFPWEVPISKLRSL